VGDVSKANATQETISPSSDFPILPTSTGLRRWKKQPHNAGSGCAGCTYIRKKLLFKGNLATLSITEPRTTLFDALPALVRTLSALSIFKAQS
jgi:hypothetical protein